MYKKIKNNFGVVGLLIIHNMLNDKLINEKLIVEGKEMRAHLNSFNEDNIRHVFQLLLHNVMIALRVLKFKKGSNTVHFWVQLAS